MAGYLQPVTVTRPELDKLRSDARLARSNAQASVDRMRTEPATSPLDLVLVESLLANSHRFARSAMALEGLLYSPREKTVFGDLDGFVHHVDRTLQALSSVLRLPPESLRSPWEESGRPPDLRTDQRQLAAAAAAEGQADSPLLLETERMTNSVNTMLASLQPDSDSARLRGRSRDTLARM